MIGPPLRLLSLALLSFSVPFQDGRDIFEHRSWYDEIVVSVESVAWESPFAAGSLTLDREQTEILVHDWDLQNADAFTIDLDSDGDNDVLYMLSEHYLIWAENRNQGDNWEACKIYSSYDDPISLSFGDFDLDGSVDPTTFCKSRKIYWFEADSGQTWLRHFVGQATSSSSNPGICVGDFNSDGADDVMSSGVTGLSYWRNVHLAGIFIEDTLSPDLQYPPFELFADDLDNDGDTDLIAFCTDRIYVMWNASVEYPDFTAESIEGSDNPIEGQICDVDGDGDSDVVARVNGVRWFENLSGSGWQQHDVTSSEVGGLAAADLDADGYAEIVTTCPEGTPHPSPVEVWDMQSPDTWNKNYYCSYAEYPGCISAGDFDGDGVPDVVLGSLWANADPEPAEQGYLVAESFQTTPGVDWGLIEWGAVTPSDSRVQFRIRSWDPGQSPSEWSDPITEPGTSLDGYVGHPDDSWIQYKAELILGSSGEMPILDYVVITYEPLAIEDTIGSMRGLLVRLRENPCIRDAVVLLDLPEPSFFRMCVYDVYGRTIREEQGLFMEAGPHELVVGDLGPGVYLLRAEVGSEIVDSKFVVLR